MPISTSKTRPTSSSLPRYSDWPFLDNGTTIHQMALMNILTMSNAFPLMIISFQDCTKHMAEGGKKDALYIANLFDKKVMEYNTLKTCTDVFYFDGASNVQKAGEVLMTRFPPSSCFHGSKHAFHFTAFDSQNMQAV